MDATDRVDSILSRFEALNRIPRQSKHEERVAEWLAGWAESAGFDHVFDDAGNLIVRVPATAGREGESPVILQGHMDMVCEKSPEATHDFARDPIEHHVDGEWLRAAGTTLGADNGIGLAYAMEAAVSFSHPPLELLFTVDEETGLTGARSLDASLLTGRILINIDSEDEGVVTIGCAGGCDGIIDLPVRAPADCSDAGSDASPDATGLRIVVGGLAGGHSGIDIDKQRGNAIRILARLLDELLRNLQAEPGLLGFSELEGGSARNAIPRDARILLAVRNDRVGEIRRTVGDLADTIRAELAKTEPSLHVEVEIVDRCEPAAAVESLTSVARLLMALPHGVQRMSSEVEGLVESSCNLALCRLSSRHVHIVSSVRSSRDSRITEMIRRIEAAACLSDAEFSTENAYPAWPPASDSALLDRAVRTYASLFGSGPSVEVIHAGLECAVIGAKIPGIEMISIGPTIKGAHSPDERLYLPSVGSVARYLEALLA